MIKADGKWLKDEHGRTVLLRGVNLGGSSKVPRTPDGATHIRQGFFDHRNVSFVGRPFPLEEADKHLRRIRAWGFSTIRLLVPWEAVEHAGPGLYDRAYLDYLCWLLEKAEEMGIQVIIDPHQDVWSRFSGGDGAPGWTFELAGMDIRRFDETCAALVHQVHGDPLPRMIWPSNANRFACATMFTLFFGGNHFAPQLRVDGTPIQEFLQAHFIGAMAQVASRLKRLTNIVGYETLNEPVRGYIGAPDLDGFVAPAVAFGRCPTILEGMMLAAGHPQEVVEREMLPRPLARPKFIVINAEQISLWLDGHDPIWQRHGVWGMGPNGAYDALRPDYFSQVGGRSVAFDRDYFYPFVERYVREMRKAAPDAVFFLNPPPSVFAGPGGDKCPLICKHNMVHAPHWYDHLTLGFQRYIPWLGLDVHQSKPRWRLGRDRVRRDFVSQVGRLKQRSAELAEGLPTWIGETGIPFNLNEGQAFETGDFALQVEAMDDTLQALEANLVGYALWNYTPDNNNLRGDQWNGEDLSIYSPAQETGTGELDDGGRALEAVVRPHVLAVAGEPVQMSFDMTTKIFEFKFLPDTEIQAPTEFYVPNLQYPNGYRVRATGGTCEPDDENQRLTYRIDSNCSVHSLRIEPAP